MSIAIAAFVALALPAAAQAATYTVGAGGGTCGGVDLTCETLAGAAGAVGNNDRVNVSPGQYASATFTDGGLEIAGTAPGVVVNGSIAFSASGGGLVRNMAVTQAGGAPAITSAGPGLEVRDVVAFSAGTDGILFTAGFNSVVRTLAITGNGDGDSAAIEIRSTNEGAKALSLESTLVRGGSAGVRGVSTGLLSGAIAIDAHHLTAAGSTRGLSVVADQILLSGTVTATIDNSITLFNNADPGLLTGASITATPGSANITSAPDKTVVFADPQNGNYRLKPGSPAIGAGSGPVAGESTTDIDGQDRSAAPTDLGADEYVNIAPTARIAVTTQIPRDGQPVQFDGGGSQDQPGGSIASYHWDFGDGKTQTTTTPTVAHTYAGEGTRTAKLAVRDGEGVLSNVASTSVRVVDGTAPSVLITTPKSKQKIFQFVRRTKTVTRNGETVKVKVKTKKRTRLKFRGTASDKSGVFRVYMIVEKKASSSTQTVVQGSQTTSTRRCRYLDAKRGLRRVRCTKPIFITIKITGTSWKYNVRKSIKLSKGTYKASLFGLDKAANFGNVAPKARRNITFTIR